MSAHYNTDPPTTAKVILHTTAGDLEIELFGKQAPLATRNFLQHCLDGYYDNTVFHRLVPGFIIQGGDPTGTGAGGESIYDGEPFADEFHSRLKFNRRGLLGMANTGKDDNGSQFFFTLAETPELNGKNTMFGKIVGDTLYNLVKMGEADLAEDSDRPLYPTMITGADIVVNPFEDMVKRERKVQPQVEDKDPKSKKKSKKGKLNNKSLLSFDVEDEADAPPVPIKGPKYNTKLIQMTDEEKAQWEREEAAKKAAESRKEAKPRTKEASPRKRSASPKPHSPVKKQRTSPSPEPSSTSKRPRSPSPSTPSDSEAEEEDRNAAARAARLQKLNDAYASEIAALRRGGQDDRAPSGPKKSKSELAIEAMLPAKSIKGRKRPKGPLSAEEKKRQEREAKSFIEGFMAKIKGGGGSAGESEGPRGPGKAGEPGTPKEAGQKEMAEGDEEDQEARLCDLHFIPNCQSCTEWDRWEKERGVEDDDNDMSFLRHKLTFEKDRLGKDLAWKKGNELVEVIDPREKARELGVERDKGRRKEGDRERGGRGGFGVRGRDDGRGRR